MRALYSYRDLVAALPSVGLIVLLVMTGAQKATSLKPKYDEPVKLEIIDIEEVPPPPPPPAPPVAPVPPVPKAPPPPEQVKTPTPQPPAPEPKPAPVAASATPAPPAQVAPPREIERPIPPVQPQAEAPPAPKANVEGEYIGRIRAYLNSIKRYPTGREASLQRPQGTVKVWFIIRRDGSLVEMGIEETANSTLLDNAARQTVSRASFPAFPEQFRPGDATHRFTVELQFAPAS